MMRRARAQWRGQTLPTNDGFGPLALPGRIRTAPDSTTLDNADAQAFPGKQPGAEQAVDAGADDEDVVVHGE